MDRCPDRYEPPPMWLQYFSISIFLLTLPSSIYTLYLILLITPPHTDRLYKIYLIIYHVAASLYSLINALSGYVQYFPALLVVETGMLRFNSIIYIFVDVCLQVLVVSLGGVVIVHRFIIVIYGREKKKFQILFILLTIIFLTPFTIISIICAKLYDDKSAVQNLLRDCPHFKPLVDTTDFLYINDNRLFNSVLVILVFTTFIIIFTLLGLIAYFGYLFKEKFRLCSETKRRLQYRLMLNSALSLMIPSFSHGIPALLGQALMLFKISSLQIWTSSLIWIIGSLHGILNCITFITLNDYYRSKFKKDVDTVVEAMRILSKSQVYSTS